MKGRVYKIKIYCKRCNYHLLTYLKEGGEPQALVKCYKNNIIENYTDDLMHCPNCGEEFSRGETIIHGRPAYKISRGKVYIRR